MSGLSDKLRDCCESDLPEVADATADLLDAIDALHQPDDAYDLTALLPVKFCKSCRVAMPCPTARLLHLGVRT